MKTFFPRLLGARYSDIRIFFPGRKYDFLTDFGGKTDGENTARTFCRSCFYCFPSAAAAAGVLAPLDARSSRSRADAFPMCGGFFFFTRKLIQLRQIVRDERPAGRADRGRSGE